MADMTRKELALLIANNSQVNLRGLDLSNLDLSKLDLSLSILDYSNLSGSNLSSCLLVKSSIVGANMSKCNLREACFDQADLSNCDLTSSDLRSARFLKANLKNAELSGAILDPSNDVFGYSYRLDLAKGIQIRRIRAWAKNIMIDWDVLKEARSMQEAWIRRLGSENGDHEITEESFTSEYGFSPEHVSEAIANITQLLSGQLSRTQLAELINQIDSVTRPISVLIASDRENTRYRLERFLSYFKEIQLLHVASSGNEAISECDSQKPDIVCIDTNVQDPESLTTVSEIVSRSPHSQVIAFCLDETSNDVDSVRRHVRSGAWGFACAGYGLIEDIQRLSKYLGPGSDIWEPNSPEDRLSDTTQEDEDPKHVLEFPDSPTSHSVEIYHNIDVWGPKPIPGLFISSASRPAIGNVEVPSGRYPVYCAYSFQDSTERLERLELLEPNDLWGIDFALNRELTDADLSNLNRLSALRYINLGTTPITDEGLNILGKHDCVQILILYETNISDDSMKLLRNFPSLESLCLDGTQITDDGLQYLRLLPKLKRLSICGSEHVQETKFTDIGIGYLSEIEELEHLEVSGKISGIGFSAFSGHPMLRKLSIFSSNLSKEGIIKLHNVKSLRELKIAGNINDSMMRKICSLTDLVSLDIASPDISDAGLKSIKKLINLETLSINCPCTTHNAAKSIYQWLDFVVINDYSNRDVSTIINSNFKSDP